MLFWKLIEINEKFAAYAKESSSILTVLAAIVHFTMANKGNPSEILKLPPPPLTIILNILFQMRLDSSEPAVSCFIFFHRIVVFRFSLIHLLILLLLELLQSRSLFSHRAAGLISFSL